MYRADAEQRVDLRHLVHHLRAVSLGEAAGDDYAFEMAVLLQPGDVEDVVYRLLLCRRDEGAGVDDDYVGVDVLGDDLVSGVDELFEHHFGVDLIFRASERDEADLRQGVLSVV